MDKKVDIIKDADGKSIVVINDLRFKARMLVRHAEDGKLYL